MKHSKKKLSNINQFLIRRLKEEFEFNDIEIYHFRAYKEYPNGYFGYKHEVENKDRLHNGFTVICVRPNKHVNELIGVISSSGTSNFDKTIGLNVALKRLLNYLSKSNDGSWNYNPKYHFTLKLDKNLDVFDNLLQNKTIFDRI